MASDSGNGSAVLVEVVVFSKDRAFQLKEYLRSASAHLVGGAVHFTVLFKASDERFARSYRRVAELFPGVAFVEEDAFDAQLKQIVHGTSAPLILWGVDDAFFYRDFDVAEAADTLLNAPNVLFYSLRLHPGITVNHPRGNVPMKPPSFVPRIHGSSAQASREHKEDGGATEAAPQGGESAGSEAKTMMFIRFEGTLDWNYPWELCSTMFRTSDVRDVIQGIEKRHGVQMLRHPNTLEVYGNSVMQDSLPAHMQHMVMGACSAVPVMSVLTVNRVQDLYQNAIYDENAQDIEALDELLWQGAEIDEEHYRANCHRYQSVHIGDFVLKQRA